MPSIAEWLGRSDAPPAFVRWQQEAEKHDRAGDYAWMAERLTPARVLEIGCGVGFGTLALQRRGFEVLALEPEADCIAIASSRCGEDRSAQQSGIAAKFLQVSAGSISDAARREIEAFAPVGVLCWLMGATDELLDRTLPPAQAVQKYREAVHRQAAELAASLPSVQFVQLVDRTAFPWKIKDTARETLIFYHRSTTFAELPFKLDIKDAVYRKLDERQWPASSAASGQRGATGMLPVIGSLLAHRA